MLDQSLYRILSRLISTPSESFLGASEVHKRAFGYVLLKVLAIGTLTASEKSKVKYRSIFCKVVV
jgi:hypothetical protein